VNTLALSFDHRVMDARQRCYLLADTAAFLRDPALATL
jgi:pyruvate dehydrogenase E2 component (dihydrolipoamide acetyltransferase)